MEKKHNATAIKKHCPEPVRGRELRRTAEGQLRHYFFRTSRQRFGIHKLWKALPTEFNQPVYGRHAKKGLSQARTANIGSGVSCRNADVKKVRSRESLSLLRITRRQEIQLHEAEAELALQSSVSLSDWYKRWLNSSVPASDLLNMVYSWKQRGSMSNFLLIRDVEAVLA